MSPGAVVAFADLGASITDILWRAAKDEIDAAQADQEAHAAWGAYDAGMHNVREQIKADRAKADAAAAALPHEAPKP